MIVFEEFSSFILDDNDREFVDEYVVTYSKYLTTARFKLIEKEMIDLARRGHIRSLAKYIKNVKPEEWVEDLKDKALEIKNRRGARTPQEWEVVAAMQWHEPLLGCDDENLSTINDLRIAICKAGRTYGKAKYYYDRRKFDEDKFYKICKDYNILYSHYEKQPYLQTLKMVQEGYYYAYVEKYHALDATGFFESTLEPDNLYIQEDNLMQYGNGVIYDRVDFADFIIKNFDKASKNEDIQYEDFYAYGMAQVLYGKNEKKHNEGVRALMVTSEFEITKKIEADKEKVKV